MTTANRELWTTTQLAEAANVSTAYLRRIMIEGRLKGEKLGHIWTISNDEAQKFLNRKDK